MVFVGINTALMVLSVTLWHNPVALVQAAAINPVLPASYVDTDYPILPSNHAILNVSTSCAGIANCFDDPQSAITSAQAGEEVVLQAGQVFTGTVNLPAKSCTLSNQNQCWIVIRTSQLSSLPTAGNRVGPGDVSNMAVIKTPAATTPALKAAPGSSYYRIVGIEFRSGSTSASEIVTLGTNDLSQTSMDQVPSHIILDRVYIHGAAASSSKRGVGLNSMNSAVVDSYISDIHVVGQDTQAIAGFNTPGPLKINNNYLEAAGENVLFGGADPVIANLVASDIEFTNNYLYKPRSWGIGDPSYAGTHWAVKNIFELKNAQRVMISGNIFDGNWVDGQSGRAVLFTVRNQDGHCPWCQVQDVTFQNNIVRHTAGALSITGHDNNFPSALTQRIKISNNLFEDINGPAWGGDGKWLSLSGGDNENGPNDIEVTHNTIFQTGNFLDLGDNISPGVYSTKSNVVITDNLASHNDYGVIGGNTGVGNGSLDAYLPGVVFTKNILLGGTASRYSSYPENYFPADWSSVLMNQSNGDYHVLSASVYHNAGTDGHDIGANIDTVQTATATVLSGINLTVSTSPAPAPVPTPVPSPVPPSGGGGGGTTPTPVPVPPISPPITIYEDGSLLFDQGVIYLMEFGHKRPVASMAVLTAWGYKLSQARAVDTQGVPVGSGIFSANQRHVRGAIVLDHGTIYYLGEVLRYPFPSAAVYFSWGHSFSEVINSNSYDHAMPVGPIVTSK